MIQDPDRVAALAEVREEDADKRVALVGGLVGNASVPVVARRPLTSAVFHARRCAVLNVAAP